MLILLLLDGQREKGRSVSITEDGVFIGDDKQKNCNSTRNHHQREIIVIHIWPLKTKRVYNQLHPHTMNGMVHGILGEKLIPYSLEPCAYDGSLMYQRNIGRPRLVYNYGTRTKDKERDLPLILFDYGQMGTILRGVLQFSPSSTMVSLAAMNKAVSLVCTWCL